MGIIRLSELTSDMVLAEDLNGRSGRFLLAKDTKLTSDDLRILKIWGVIEADIKGISQKDVEANAEAQVDPSFIEAAEELIRDRFGHTDLDHPVNEELFRLCTLRKAEEISRGKEKTNVEQHSFSEMNIDENEISNYTKTQIDPHQLIRKDANLSTLPTLYMQINEAIEKPNSSANDIAKVISSDTGLSARLLKIVNSPFYGFPSRIDTLSRAVAIVGTKQLSSLAMGLNIINAFKNIPSDIIDMKSFLEHCIVCGIIARILASHKNIQNAERLFVAGLLHDIGRMILYNSVPDNAKTALFEAKRHNSLLYETEQKTFGFDHTQIGGLLLKKWKLPISLENIVKHHHAPPKSQNPLEPAIVHFADIMTNALGMGSSGERFVPPLDPDAWDCIGLSANILSLTIEQMDRQIEETFQFIF